MKVLVGVAIAGSLLLGVGLGRLSGRLSPASPEVPPGQIEPKDRITLSEEQLQRSGLSIIRPELSTGTERPISGFVEAAVGARSSAAMPVAGRLVRLLVAPGMAVRAGEVIAEVRTRKLRWCRRRLGQLRQRPNRSPINTAWQYQWPARGPSRRRNWKAGALPV